MNEREQDISERELRRVCLHEAAHEMLILKFGGYATAHVWTNDSEGAKAGIEKAWLGQVRMFAKPGELEMDDLHRLRFGIDLVPPANWQTLVGLAGLVAENIGDGAVEAWQIEDSIRTSFDAAEVSPTDAALIGDEWAESEVAQVMTLLLAKWAELDGRAKELEADARR